MVLIAGHGTAASGGAAVNTVIERFLADATSERAGAREFSVDPKLSGARLWNHVMAMCRLSDGRGRRSSTGPLLVDFSSVTERTESLGRTDWKSVLRATGITGG